MFDVDQVVEELLGNNHEGFSSAREADEWLCEENLTEVHGEGSDLMEKAHLLAEWIDGNVPDAIEKGILRSDWVTVGGGR